MERRSQFFIGLVVALGFMFAGVLIPQETVSPGVGGAPATGLLVGSVASPQLVLIFFGMVVAFASTVVFVRATLSEYRQTNL